MAEIVEVVDAGQGWTRVRDSDGNVFKMEGARNWRNNNPGNIEYGEFAKSLGAVGSDGRFAVFPSYDAGRQAKEQLIFSSPRYRDLTLEQAISRYAPPNENNTRAYINQVAQAAGVPASTPMSQIPTSVRGNILDTMERVEGFKVGRTYNAQGIPIPPKEIPNMVATLQDTTPPPRVAPNPATISPDLAQMRNPMMSSSARNAQVTPSPNVPLPRNRPSAPDIVTPTMASLASAPRPNANTRRAVDTGLLALTPVTPRLTPAGDNIMSYHIPDMTPTAVVGGVGSLTPTQQRQRLPELPRTVPGQSQIERIGPTAREIASAQGTTVATIPTTGIGQPPATRTVQSVPWQTPSAREIAEAQGTTVATVPTAAQALNMRSRDAVANNALGQRVATQVAPAFGQSGYVPDRLAPNPIVQPNYVPRNQPPIQVVPGPSSAPRRVAPTPMAATTRPLGLSTAPRPVAAAVQAPQPSSPLRITVNGAGSYGATAPQKTTLVRSLQAQGLSPSQAYDAANSRSRGSPSVEDRVRGETSSGSGDRLIPMEMDPKLLASLLGSGAYRYG